MCLNWQDGRRLLQLTRIILTLFSGEAFEDTAQGAAREDPSSWTVTTIDHASGQSICGPFMQHIDVTVRPGMNAR